jgi:cysteine desulfurase
VAKQLNGRNHLITCVIEHVAVLETCRYLETKGFEVTYVQVDQYGRVNPQGK